MVYLNTIKCKTQRHGNDEIKQNLLIPTNKNIQIMQKFRSFFHCAAVIGKQLREQKGQDDGNQISFEQ